MKAKGFTYVEVLAVIAVMAILLTIALFDYTQYLRETRRTAAQFQLMDIRERVISEQRSTNKPLSVVLQGIVDSATNPYYNITSYETFLSTDNTNTAEALMDYAIVATPIGTKSQGDDGVICLTLQGYRYWKEKSTNCKFALYGKNDPKRSTFKTIGEARGSKWYGD